MKIAALSVALSALAVSVIAANAVAANPNGPKPKCPLGQIPVLENNQYHCEHPSFQTQTKPAERATSTKKVQKRTKPKPPVIKPVKAKIKVPDLKIMGAKLKPGTPNTFIVTVRNIGNAAAPANAIFGTHYLQDNSKHGGGTVVPALAPGAMKHLEFVIAPNNNYSFGDKIVFDVDFQKQVIESKENNNKFSYKYPKKNPT